MAAVLVLAEHDHKEIKKATLNTVAAAQKLGGDVHVLVAGHNAGDAAKAAARSVGRLAARVCRADTTAALKSGSVTSAMSSVPTYWFWVMISTSVAVADPAMPSREADRSVVTMRFMESPPSFLVVRVTAGPRSANQHTPRTNCA